MKKYLLALSLSMLLGLLSPYHVSSAPWLPNSSDFGYGAWLHPDGSDVDQGLSMMTDLTLDWVAIPFDWAAQSPFENSHSTMSNIERVIQTAASHNIKIMLSIYNPPDWAVTSHGPKPSATINLIEKIIQEYPDQINSIELFPGANLKTAWKADPNPADYLFLFNKAADFLRSRNSNIELIAAGLTPLALTADNNGWDDFDFLDGLYAEGKTENIHIISIRFPTLSGDPLHPPENNSGFYLRRYEKYRQIMLEHHHQNGLLWITLINPPDGKINLDDNQYEDIYAQTKWLQEAIIQLNSQLYIGAVMVTNLNPPVEGTSFFTQEAMLAKHNQYHPFYNVLKALSKPSEPFVAIPTPGRPKVNTLLKCKNQP